MTKRKNIMLCYPLEEKRLLKWEPPYIVQPKLDGERCRAVKKENHWVLLSSEENEFWSVPHISQWLDEHYSSMPVGFEFDGELYRHGWPFEQIHSVVGRTVNFHPDFDKMNYHIFDIVNENEPQWQRLNQLTALMGTFGTGPLQHVNNFIAHDFQGVYDIYEELCGHGYEGIVVRHTDAIYLRRRSTLMMKFKPKKIDVYTITGYNQMINKDGEPKPMLGSLDCLGVGAGGFSVGSGMTDAFRKEAWKDPDKLIGLRVRVKYQANTEKGVPRFPVFMEVIK